MLKLNNKLEVIILYTILISLVYFFCKLWLYTKYNIELILLIVLFVSKDILKYFVDLSSFKEKKISYKKLFTNSNISNLNLFLILNRNLFFPVILILYMIYLLIWQTHLFWWDKTEIFKIINQNYFLWITIMSGILTVFKDNLDKKYFIEIKKTPILSIIFTIWLSLLWTYIIFNQVIKLGFLSYPISIISGILIFLVGISILEDNEDIENN